MDASPRETARGFARAETMIEIGTYLYVLHLPLLLLFLGGHFGVLRRAEVGSGAFSVSGLGAGVAMAIIASMGALTSAITPIIRQLGGDAATVKAIDGMAPLVLEGRIAPRWLGWAGLALGLISLISTGTLIAPALFPFLALGTLLFVVWITTLTIALLRSTRMESLIMPPADEASRVPVEPDGM